MDHDWVPRDLNRRVLTAGGGGSLHSRWQGRRRSTPAVVRLIRMGTVLVIENAPEWHLGRLDQWLREAALEPVVVRPHLGEEIPKNAANHDALIALGGGRGATWGAELSALLQQAVADDIASLAFCSSARLLTEALGGLVEPVESFNPGPRLIGRRDAALDDQLLGQAPMGLDVVWWRHDDVTEPPPGSQLLAASPRGIPEVFRIGTRMWAFQSHIELDSQMVLDLGGSQELADQVSAVTDYLQDTWRPVIARFADAAAGRSVSMSLPLLDD